MISPFAPWYRKGTVSITTGSATVTGVGTSWLFGTEIRQGDLFTLDGKRFYEIAASPSATTLTLQTNFEEATVTDASYAVIRNFAVIPSTELIIRTLDTTKIWKDFQDKMFEWQTKPYNATTPATVGFIGLDGETTTIKSLPQVVGETNIQSYSGYIQVDQWGPLATNDTIPFDTAAHHNVVVDKNTTLTFGTPAQTAKLLLQLVGSTSETFQVTFPANAKTRLGVPLGTITVGAMDLFEFFWDGINFIRINA